MKRYLLLFVFVMAIGCGGRSLQPVEDSAPTEYRASKNGESTSAAYWKCSKEKGLYMQLYTRTDGGQWRPAGAFKLGQGIGAVPLKDMDKYKSDGENVSIDVGHDHCPYCGNTTLGQCRGCGKTLCESEDATRGTCPWCNALLQYERATWSVGGGG
jgi:hypothetical protein